MNVRQQKYKENRLKGMSAYRSAIEAGYSHNTAIAATRNIEKRIDFDSLMKAHGLDDDSLLKVLKDGLSVVSSTTGQPNLTTKSFLEIALKLGGKLKDRVEHTGKDGEVLPTPIVNVYVTKNTTDRPVHTSESIADSGQSRLSV